MAGQMSNKVLLWPKLFEGRIKVLYWTINGFGDSNCGDAAGNGRGLDTHNSKQEDNYGYGDGPNYGLGRGRW